MAKVIICDECGKVIGAGSPDGLYEVFSQQLRLLLPDSAEPLPEVDQIYKDLCRDDAEKAGWPKKVV